MDKESKAYKSREFEDMFEAAEIGSLAAEDIVAYSQSKRKYDDTMLAYQYSYSQGEAQGKAEEQARMIRVMHSNGMSIELISKYLEMPLADVERIIR